MKKKILSIAAAVMAFTTFGAMAQNPAANSAATTCTEQCAQGGKTCQAQPQDGKRRGDKAPKADPFTGINLTEAQKAKIKEINEQRQAQRGERKQGERADREAAQRQYLSDVKGVLTPDQYVVFLENIVVSGPQGGPRMQARGPKSGKGKAAGQRAQRQTKVAGQRTQRQAKADEQRAQRVTGPSIQATSTRTAQ